MRAEMYPRSADTTKICPQCGTRLIFNARRCSVCGNTFGIEESAAHGQAAGPRPFQVTFSLPGLLLFVAALLIADSLVLLSMQKRLEKKTLVAASNITATYIATAEPTLTITATSTRTAVPPSETPLPDIEYTTVSGDSCLSIVTRFKVDLARLIIQNNLNCDLLPMGKVITIPRPSPTPGPPPGQATTTLPASGNAPEPLQPANGAAFTRPGSAITLQWSARTTLQKNESYEVVIADMTGGADRTWIVYTTQTSYALPTIYRPTDSMPHIFTWSVKVVQQTGLDQNSGSPIWEAVSGTSQQRVFSWMR
jgi:LysM domain